jgi:hypothetical protein
MVRLTPYYERREPRFAPEFEPEEKKQTVVEESTDDLKARIIKYTELYDPEKRNMPLVSPRKIPIHPFVFNSKLYTADFCRKVLTQLETSIDYDLRNMKNRLGISIDFKGVDEFEARADPTEKTVEFGYNGARIILSPGTDKERILRQTSQLPQSLPNDRAMRFSRTTSGLEVPSWYAETKEVEDLMRDPTMRLAFRNAAILFNNLGVLEVGKN